MLLIYGVVQFISKNIALIMQVLGLSLIILMLTYDYSEHQFRNVKQLPTSLMLTIHNLWAYIRQVAFLVKIDFNNNDM